MARHQTTLRLDARDDPPAATQTLVRASAETKFQNRHVCPGADAGRKHHQLSATFGPATAVEVKRDKIAPDSGHHPFETCKGSAPWNESERNFSARQNSPIVPPFAASA